MRNLRIALSMLAALALGTPSFAADMPLKAPPMVVPAPPSWSGFYAGVGLGGKWVTNDWDTTCVNLGGPLFQCGSPLNAIVFPGAPDVTAHNSFTNSGFRPSVYFGTNVQLTNTWVVGWESDFGWYNKSTTVAGIPGCSTAACTGGLLVPFNLSGDSATVRDKWDASFRLRAGFLVLPDLMLYGTGGAAFQKIEASLTCNGNTSPMCFASQSDTQSKRLLGWTAGGGIEWKVWQNLLLRGEYRFSDFGTWNPVFFLNNGIAEVRANIHTTSHIATFGIAYLFPPPRF
jgi:outer membrane immunogenic protein